MLIGSMLGEHQLSEFSSHGGRRLRVVSALSRRGLLGLQGGSK